MTKARGAWDTFNEVSDRITDAREKKLALQGLEPHYRVHVHLPGSVVRLASRSEPVLELDEFEVVDIDAVWITDPAYGDSLGFVAWDQVLAVTWRRYSP